MAGRKFPNNNNFGGYNFMNGTCRGNEWAFNHGPNASHNTPNHSGHCPQGAISQSGPFPAMPPAGPVGPFLTLHQDAWWARGSGDVFVQHFPRGGYRYLRPQDFPAGSPELKSLNDLKSSIRDLEALRVGLKGIQREIMRADWLVNNSTQRTSAQISQITDALFLCAARAITEGNVRALGITCVINVTTELPFAPLGSGMEYMKIQIVDSPTANLGSHFDAVADKIYDVRRKGGRTLIHCVAGVSRSAALCMVYLVKYEGLTLREAYYHVRGRRPIVRPNVGFFRQMIEYEKRLLGKTSVSLVPNPVGPGTGLIPDVYEEEFKQVMAYEQQRRYQPMPGSGSSRHGRLAAGASVSGGRHHQSSSSSAPPMYRIPASRAAFPSSIAVQQS